jgi:hypothetical protein
MPHTTSVRLDRKFHSSRRLFEVIDPSDGRRFPVDRKTANWLVSGHMASWKPDNSPKFCSYPGKLVLFIQSMEYRGKLSAGFNVLQLSRLFDRRKRH